MQDEQSAIALLLFRVGPVLCCAPADPIQSIISPPKLTHPPGACAARPGIFYHANRIVSVNDLRHRFGIPEGERQQPGRLIITLQGEAFIAYWVDEIIEVIDTPKEGWSAPPSHLPKGVFSKTLLLKEKIYLFAHFGQFENLPESDYLIQYIDGLNGQLPRQEVMEEIQEPVIEPVETSIAPVTPAHSDIGKGQEELPVESDNEQTEHASSLTMDESEPTQVNQPEETAQSSLATQGQSLDAAPDIADHDEPAEIPMDDEPPLQVHDQAEQDRPPPQSFDQPVTVTPDEISSCESATSPAPPGRDDEIPAAQPPDRGEEEQDRNDAPPPPRTKTDYLKPVPAVVPESEREPSRPPFPWKNLAAAVVLFLTLAGIGIYYLRTANNPTVTQTRPTPSPPIEQIPDKVVHEEEKPATTIPTVSAPLNTETAGHTEKQAATVAAIAEDSRYQAEIKPDKQGVTIVLHSPEDEPVLKTAAQKPASNVENSPVGPASDKKPARFRKEEIIHTVVKGDTLWAIAEHYVKDPYKYPKLAELSKISNPDRIYPGNRVRILRHMQNTE